MRQLIQSLDFNGAQPQLSFFDNDFKFKTIKGGILSIMIYILGFAYFFYLMFMWLTYQIPPVVINQLEFFPGLRQYELVQPLFVFALIFDLSQKQKLASFDGEIYKQRSFSNEKQSNLTTNPPGYDCQQSNDQAFKPVCINLNDQYQTNLVQNFKNRSQDSYLYLNIMHCDQDLDDKCMSQKNQDEIFFDMLPQWRFTLITQDLNLQTGAITNIPQDYFYYAYGYNEVGYGTLTFDLKVQKTTYVIDDGIIFPKLRQIEIIRSIDLQTSQQPLYDSVTGSILLARIKYSLQSNEQVIRVTHPKLGQILAELGYSLQFFLFLGWIMNKFNTSLMNAMAEDSLLKIYFPHFKLFDFRYDWKGKIKTVMNKGHILNKSHEQYILNLRKTLGLKVRSKLNYINILHELSRVQLLLQMELPRQQIVISQKLGYRVKLPDKYVVSKQVDGKSYESDFDHFLKHEQYEDFQRKLNQPLKSSQNKQKSLQKQYTFGDSLISIWNPQYSQNNLSEISASIQSKEPMKNKKDIHFMNDSDFNRSFEISCQNFNIEL